MEDFHSLLILMVIIWLMGKLFRMFTLPVVFGELLGGILVGPIALNLVDPGSFTIKVLAELGIFFLMLHAGLETDPTALIKGSKKAILIAFLGVLIPLLGGFIISKYFGYSLIQCIFVGVAISATSIAIAVRVLKDCHIRNTQFATKVLGAALITDIIVLVIFSAVIKLVETGSINANEIIFFLIKILLFFSIVIVAGFKLSKYTKKYFTNRGFTLTLVIAMVLGYFAEWIGLHVVVGAFLAGLFIHEELLEGKTFQKIEDRIYGLSYGFLGPIFFTSLAFNLDFKGIIEKPALFLALFGVAYFGKLFGASFAALIQKVKPIKSVLIGLTMNSRGALDLVIISIGLKYRIIDQQLFSILIAIAFIATLLSIFLMRMLKRQVKFKYR
jgi:Kef-type K+ transport system membrane component KefB